MAEIFNDTRALLQNPSIAGFEYGTKPVLFSDGKPIAKLANAAERVKAAGILPQDAKINAVGIVHGHDSNPPFVEMILGDTSYLVNMRVVQFDGEKHFTNSDFDIQSVAEDIQRERMSIITGVCLFGSNAALGITEKGEQISITDPSEIRDLDPKSSGRIISIEVDKRLQPYEADTILRIGGFIQKLNQTDEQRLFVHVPRMEYYLYGVELVRKGAMDPAILNTWFDQVDMRATGLSTLMAKRIPQSINFGVTTTLQMVEDYMSDTDNLSMDKTVGILQQDDLWNKLIRTSPPHSFIDIGYLSYQYTYLSLANRGTAVAVENPEEQSILINTRKVMDKVVDRGTIVALYPHPNLLLKEGPKKFMYFYPNHNGHLTQALLEINRANKGIYENTRS